MTREQEMLKELMEKHDITELGRAMSFSRRKMFGLIDGTEEMKPHAAKEIRSHYEMKKRVREATERMNKLAH